MNDVTKKQQIIINAYGQSWELVKPYVDENGWIKYIDLSPLAIGFDFRYHNLEFKENNDWRPKVLSNLLYNNGWTEIKSIEDLPNEDYVYWVMRKDLKLPMYRKVNDFTEEEKAYWLKTFSHFQKILSPLSPIF